MIAFLWAALLLGVTLLRDNSIPESIVMPKMFAFAFGGGVFAVGALWLSGDRRFVFDVPALAVTSFFAFLLLRGAFAGEHIFSISVKILAWLLYMAAHSLSADERRFLDPAVAVVGAIQAVIMLLQALKLCGGYMTFGQPGRFENPAGSALCVAMALPFCFGMIRNGGTLSPDGEVHSRPLMRAAGYVCAALILAGIVVADSRAGFLSALMCVAALMMSLRPSLRSRKVVIPMAVAAVAVCVALYFYKKDSASGRMYIWQNTVAASMDKPVLGHGPGHFHAVYMPRQAKFFTEHPDSPAVMRSNDIFSPFSEYLHLLCEYGIAGVLLLAAAIVLLLKKSRLKLLPLLAVGVFAIFAAVSYPLRYSAGLLLLLYALSDISGKPVAAPRKSALVCAVCSLAVLALMWPVFRDYDFRKDWKAVQSKYSSTHADDSQIENDISRMDAREIDDYMALYVRKCYEDDFLYDFSRVLMQHGKYSASIEILDETSHNEFSTQMVYGADYLNLHNYPEAISHYTLAHHMVPCRFLPLYFLMQSYDESGDAVGAVETAAKILELPVKVPSRDVRTVQSTARDVVRKYGGVFKE